MRVLAVLLFVAAACRDPREPATIDALDGTRVRVATFNVRRFFDTICESGACEVGDYEAVASEASFEQRAVQVAAAIRTLDADIISLQEVETQACLDALVARLEPAHAVLGEIGAAASVDVAVLAKTPIDRVVRHRDANPLVLPDGRTTTFSRELLEVHARASDGTPLVLVAAHFKAKSNDDPARRLAEAQTAARIVNELATREPDAVVVLAGDLNDTPGSPPLDALTVDGGLVRLADDLALTAQATYYYQGRAQAIDHLLLVPGDSAARIPRSSRVWREGGAGWGGSDHAALTSELALPR